MFANIKSGTLCRLTLKLITFTLPLRSLFYPLTKLFSDFIISCWCVEEGTLAFSLLSSPCYDCISKVLDMPPTKTLVFSPTTGCLATCAAVFMITLRVFSFSHSFIRRSFWRSSCKMQSLDSCLLAVNYSRSIAHLAFSFSSSKTSICRLESESLSRFSTSLILAFCCSFADSKLRRYVLDF